MLNFNFALKVLEYNGTLKNVCVKTRKSSLFHADTASSRRMGPSAVKYSQHYEKNETSIT